MTNSNNGFLINTNINAENQAGTQFGHISVSVSESFWAKIGRYGRPKNVNSLAGTISDTTGITYPIYLNPSIGTIFYPKKVIASASVSGVAVVYIKTNIPQANNTGAGMADPVLFSKRVSAGEGLVLDFDGEIFVVDGGQVQVGFWPDTTGGKFSGSIYGLEVMPDA